MSDAPLLALVAALPEPRRPAVSIAFPASACPILAWVATLTAEERAFVAARLGPEEPWELEGAIVSEPEPNVYSQRYIDRMKRRRGKAAAVASWEDSPV